MSINRVDANNTLHRPDFVFNELKEVKNAWWWPRYQRYRLKTRQEQGVTGLLMFRAKQRMTRQTTTTYYCAGVQRMLSKDRAKDANRSAVIISYR